jgi:hypothetical protein
VRSLITLKALTYAPTGGIAAAATTSLPEAIGGIRNWDYRYTWLRDSALTLYALQLLGYEEPLPGQQATVEAAQQEIRHLRAAVEQQRTTDRVEHERLARDTQRAVAQVTTDGQVLDHVREIIRFFKEA